MKFSLVAGARRLVEIHILCDCHKNAFIALYAVPRFDLRPGKKGCSQGEEDGQDNERLGWQVLFDIGTKIPEEASKKNENRHELHKEQRQRKS